MKFISLELYNFVTHAKSFFDAERDESIFIAGENKDAMSIGSNGSGKSLLYDAVVWCLYDTTIRGFSKDDVIGSADSCCYVETIWQDDQNREVKVRRYRGHKKHGNKVFLYIDGEDSSKVTSATTTGTNAQIIRLFGKDDIGFVYSVVFSKSRGSVCDENQAGRGKLISKIMRLDDIDEAHRRAKKDEKDIQTTINGMNVKISSVETEIVEIQRQIETSQDHLKHTVDKIAEATADLAKRADAQMKEIADLMRNYTVESLVFAEASVAMDKEKKIDDEVAAVYAKISKAENSHAKAHAKFCKKDQEVSMLNEAIENFKQLKNATCPTCMQNISPTHAKRHVHEMTQIRTNLVADRSEAGDKVAKVKKKLEELHTEKKRLLSFKDKKTSQRYYDSQSNVTHYRRQLSIVRKKFDVPTVDISDYRLINELENLNHRLGEARSSLDNLKTAKSSAEEKLSIVQFWVKAFGSKGMKAYIIKSILDGIEQRSNEYLHTLTDGYMSIRWLSESKLKTSDRVVDSLLLMIDTGNGKTREYHNCSEGEKARVWLAVELALNDICRGQMDVAFIDECFDGLDAEGVKRAVELVSNVGRKRKIICISHRDGVESHFDRKVKVVMSGGVSSLSAA